MDLFDHAGRDVEHLGLAVDEDGDLILHVQVFAVGAMAVGPAASASALDKRAREHLAKRAEAADEASTGLEIRVAGIFLTDSNNSVRYFRSRGL